MSKSKANDSHSRPLPWLCADCFTYTVVPTVMTHTAQVKHDGIVHELSIPNTEVPRCQTCGVTYPTDAVDDQISDALRVKLRLLTPGQIQNEIKHVGYKQHEIAKHLGVTPESISRWATGALIQSRAMDNLLRMYFGIPQAREMVRRLYEMQQSDVTKANSQLPGNPGASDPIDRIKSRYGVASADAAGAEEFKLFLI